MSTTISSESLRGVIVEKLIINKLFKDNFNWLNLGRRRGQGVGEPEYNLSDLGVLLA